MGHLRPSAAWVSHRLQCAVTGRSRLIDQTLGFDSKPTVRDSHPAGGILADRWRPPPLDNPVEA